MPSQNWFSAGTKNGKSQTEKGEKAITLWRRRGERASLGGRRRESRGNVFTVTAAAAAAVTVTAAAAPTEGPCLKYTSGLFELVFLAEFARAAIMKLSLSVGFCTGLLLNKN